MHYEPTDRDRLRVILVLVAVNGLAIGAAAVSPLLLAAIVLVAVALLVRELTR